MKTYILLMAFLPIVAFAEEPKLTLDGAVDLYWHCDYASTKTLLGTDQAAACSVAFEKIKKEKFNGDFSEFMKWWKANKTAEHAKIAKKG